MASTFIQLPPDTGGGGGGSVNSVTASGPLFSSGGTDPNLTITKSDATHNGYLASADFVTFNAKQPAATAVLSVNTITPTTGNVTLTTTNIAEGSNLYFTNARAQTAAVENAINSGTTNKAPAEAAVFTALGGKLDRPSLFFFVGSNGYNTIQSAINAAELLPQADSTDDPTYQSGIEIFIPAGNYDESITITKNINLFGMGGWGTQINQLAIRPFSATNCPQNVTMKNLFINTVFLTNETPGLGVFNPNVGLWAVHFENCISFGFDTFQNINNVEFQSCKLYGDIPMTNCPSVLMLNTANDSTATFITDTTLPNQPTNFMDGMDGLQLFNCNMNTVVPDTVGASTLFSLIVSTQSSINQFNPSANSQYYIDGGYVAAATIDPASVNLYYKCDGPYTMTTPTDWTSPVNKVDDALDQLAARVKALE